MFNPAPCSRMEFFVSSAQPKLIADPNARDTRVWKRQLVRLRFVFAGRVLFAVRWPGMLLNAPFNHASVDPSMPPAAPDRFPPGIQALRILSCPLQPASAPIA